MGAFQFASEQLRSFCEKQPEACVDGVEVMEDDLVKAIANLWQDEAARGAFHRRNEFQLSDSASRLVNEYTGYCLSAVD